MNALKKSALSFLCCILYGISDDVTASNFSTKLITKSTWNMTMTDKLKHDLLLNYDKFSRPAQHYNTTVVTLGLTIRHIDLDESKSILTVNSWTRLSWNDEKLKWNSTDYEGLTTLHLAEHEIWQPDILLYNSASGSSIDHYGNTHCLVHEDGTTLWVPPSQFLVFCDLNLNLWPYDTQQCSLMLGSWTYHGNLIDIKLEEGETDVELFVQNTEWELVKITQKRNVKTYVCCEEPYVDVTFNLTIKRKSPTYDALIITPIFAVVTMTLVNFWLPPQAGEKILLNGCTIIVICIFFLFFAQKCSVMGAHTPLVVLFYSRSLYILSFSLIGSVVVLWISRSQHMKPLPWILKQPLTGWPGKWLGLGYLIEKTSRVNTEEMRDQNVVFDDHVGDEHHIITPSPRQPCQQEWILFAAAIDRLSFIFYSLLFANLAVIYSI